MAENASSRYAEFSCLSDRLIGCLERYYLHDPCSGSHQRCGSAVASRRRHDPVLGDVKIRGGYDTAREIRTWSREAASGHASSKYELAGRCSRNRPAVCCRAISRSRTANVQRVQGIETAILRGANI